MKRNAYPKTKCLSQLPALLLAAFFLTALSYSRADQMDNYVKRQMLRQHIPGLSLAVVRDGKIIKAKGYGLANVELNVPATKDTVYEIGSMTKQFTATAIMLLVEEGKIGLDDKITNYLSGLPSAWSEITVRHLLTHTSGIKGYLDIPNVLELTMSPIAMTNLVKMVSAYPLAFRPGDKFVYSNTGYYLLGRIIENVSHKSYADFLRENIFNPLGMNVTCVNDLKTILTNRASGYSEQNGKLRRADYMDMSWPFAAGALVTTVTDMAKWDAALYTEKLLPRTRLEQMWTPVKMNDGGVYPYGFGWYIFGSADHRLLAHDGGIPGFVSCIGRWADDRVTVVVLLNSDGGRDYIDYLIAQGIARRFIPRLVAKPIEDTMPAVTAKLRTALVTTISGTLDPELFTEATRKGFFPTEAKRLQSELNDLGPMKSFLLLNKKDAEKSHQYGYRAVFAKESLLLDVTLNEGGKISGFEVEFE